MALQWIPGRIENRHVWSDGLFTLRVRCPGVEAFQTGQFLQVGLQLPEKHLHRPYSVASPHGDVLDFFIVRVDHGELTPRLWNLTEGDSVDISAKATGGFTLAHTPRSKVLWLMCTGTGLAPYIAMLREGEVFEHCERVIVVHGVRYSSDMAYQHELQIYHEQDQSRFQFVPVISREQPPNALHGRITSVIENGLLEQYTGSTLSPETSVVMMCGNPQMLDDVELMLSQRGMHRHKKTAPGHVVVERYW